jgi:hypothetical protein
MNVGEFLNLCAYVKDKQNEEKAQRWKMEQQLKR